MKKKRLLAIVMSLCLTAAALVGCGGSGGGSQESAQSSAGAETTAESAAGTEAAESAAASLDSLPAAVGEGTITATPEMYSSIDLSEPYTVNMYLIGDTPNDWDRILELTNEYLEPFNTSLNVTIMSWSDYQTMYSLVNVS